MMGGGDVVYLQCWMMMGECGQCWNDNLCVIFWCGGDLQFFV